VLLRTTDRLPRAALALAIAAVVACAPAPAVAVPASTAASSALDVKKAEQAAAQADLGALKANLAAQVDEYVSIGRRIEETKREISAAAAQTAQLDSALATAHAALSERAVQLYQQESGSMFELLLCSESVQDFVLRTEYLALVSQRDAALLDQVRLLHSQSLYVQQTVADHLARLTTLQADADDRRVTIINVIATQQAKARALGQDVAHVIATQQAKARALGQDVARLMREQAKAVTGGTPSGKFDPDTVVSEANFRAATSMTAADIQTFLNQQPGTLKSYRAADHNGKASSAAQMIAEASVAHGISPKIILATLQKEQSLLTRQSPTKESYDWAMGCGKADSFTSYQYQGLGKQIWYGAYKFKQNAALWSPGATQMIDGSAVHPTNAGTHAQYHYTPHMGGVMSFWMIYWRYFGDPLA